MSGGLHGFLLGVLLMLGPSVSVPPGGECLVAARLVDTAGRPVSGARLGVRSLTGEDGGAAADRLALADGEGRATLVLAPDVYRLAAASDRHPTSERTLDLTASCAPGALGTLVFEDGLAIVGRVVDAADRPLAEGRLRISWDPRTPRYLGLPEGEPFPPVREAVTGADGRFVLPGLSAETEYAVFVTRPGFAPARLLALAGGPPLVATLEEAASVVLEVVDGAGRAIAGAAVEIDAVGVGESFGGVRSLEQTDEAGRYLAPSVPPGEVVIAVRSPGHEAARRVVALAAGETRQERFVLPALPSAPVALRIVADGGRPVPGAQARLTPSPRPPDGPDLVARSDADGQITWPRVALGVYELSVQAPAGSSLERRDPLVVELTPAGIEREVVLARPEGRPVAGRVVDAAGSGVAGAEIAVQAGAARLLTRAGGDGRFRFEHLPYGTHQVTLHVPGLAGLPAREARVAPEAEPWIFELPPGTAVTGRLLLAPGLDPAGPWRLGAQRAGGGRAEGGQEKDARFRFPPLAPGAWTLSASHGRARGAVEIEIAGGTDELRQDIEVPAPAAGYPVFGIFTRHGSPLPGLIVGLMGRAVGESLETLSAVTDDEGRFTIANVPEGSYQLAVSARFPVLHRTVEIAGPTDLGRELHFAWLRGRVTLPSAATAPELSRVGVRLSPRGPADESAGWFHVTHSYPEWVRPGSDGSFEVGPLEEGRWLLEASAPGHVTLRREVLVDGVDIESLVLELQPAATLEVRIATASGRPPGYASFHLRPREGPDAREFADARATAAGPIRFEELPPGPGTLAVETEYAEVRDVPFLAPGPPIDVALPARGAIDLRAPFLSAEQAAAVAIVVHAADGDERDGPPVRRTRFYTPARPRSRIVLPPGLYDVRLEAADLPLWSALAEVRDHETTELLAD